MLKLSEIPKNTNVLIKDIQAGNLSQRLIALGFYPNQKISVTSKALFGDPIAVKVGHSTVLLRNSEAAGVLVEIDQ